MPGRCIRGGLAWRATSAFAADVPYFFKVGARFPVPVPVEDDPDFAGGRSFANPPHWRSDVA